MCATLRRIGATMPSYIRKANVTQAHLALPIIRNPKNHYYVLSSWSDLRAVIKLVMLLNPNKLVKITSDREIRDVYVGSKSKKAMSEGTDNEIINSLEDLVDQPFLVIIRLNELRYKNKAAAGALEEAMSIRLDRDKPLWVINNRDEPFGKGSIAWSGSVDDLISGMQYIQIPVINQGSDESLAPSTFDEGSDREKDIRAPSLNRKKRPPIAPAPVKADPSPLHLVDIDEEQEPMDLDMDAPAPGRQGLKIDTSGVREDDSNPLSQYGSGLSSKKNRKHR